MLALEEDESRIKLANERLRESEQRNGSILKEIDEMRKELDELRQQNNRYQKDNLD
jgi:chromosome segregation ATPase